MSGYATNPGTMNANYAAKPDRPLTRLESELNWLREVAALQADLNERLTGLANGLCGGHPTTGGKEQAPHPVASGLTDEFHETISTLKERQAHSFDLISRLAEAIPEVR